MPELIGVHLVHLSSPTPDFRPILPFPTNPSLISTASLIWILIGLRVVASKLAKGATTLGLTLFPAVRPILPQGRIQW